MNYNELARNIKNAHTAYMAARAEADRLEDMLNDAIDAGETTDEIEMAWEAAVSEEVRYSDDVVAELQKLGISYSVALQMVVNPKYSEKFAQLCARLQA